MLRINSLMLVEEIINARTSTTKAQNSMGCSENWYDSYYAIANTFSDYELREMSGQELNNLILLADKMVEALTKNNFMKGQDVNVPGSL